MNIIIPITILFKREHVFNITKFLFRYIECCYECTVILKAGGIMIKLLISISIILWSITHISATEDKQIILQNGLNGYTGCEDTYIMTKGFDVIIEADKNFSTEDMLRSAD